MQWDVLTFTDLTPSQLYAILRLRQQVFVVEQQCAYADIDGVDPHAMHMLCMQGSDLLAYQRCLPPDTIYPESSIGRIVVSPEMRGQQLGRELVRQGISYNLSHWPQCDIRISAQAHLQPFYSSLGFVAEGSEYLLDHIPHRQMRYAVVGG